MNAPAYLKLIRGELARRTEKNSRYSLRAFARALGMDPPSLAHVLNGTRVPSVKIAGKLVERLGLSPEESGAFWRSLAEQKQAQGLQRISPQIRQWLHAENAPSAAGEGFSPKELSLELFRAIGDWYHAAILELTFVEGFQANTAWISHELGITELEARLALDRFFEFELLEKTSDGSVRKSNKHLATADKQLTTAAHRRHQRQILEKSAASLENDPIEVRNHSSMTMATDSSLMPEARRRILAFQRELCLFLESAPKLTCVYELQTSLFPLQQTQKGEKA